MLKKRFVDLTEREILALAISQEEGDMRIYAEFADALKDSYPSTSEIFSHMADEENIHRQKLFGLYRERFGERIPPITRNEVRGFIQRKPVWLFRPLRIETVRRQAALMELETRTFYERAIEKVTDVGIRQLLGDLAAEEKAHQSRAEELVDVHTPTSVMEEEQATARKLFVLQVIQPGLAGLMDGSVSTLAPLFAAAIATGSSSDAFLVGIAASLGAGISMGFAEALSDDGSLTGRGKPFLRGIICGLMTFVGGLGHTFPFLVGNFRVAMGFAITIVAIELGVIAWIRHRYMDTPWFTALLQVVLGGALVFLAGILIGNA